MPCSPALLAGTGPAAADEARTEGDRAMEVLMRSVADGYRKLALMRSAPALDALRPRPEFQALLMDLAFPDRPFAP